MARGRSRRVLAALGLAGLTLCGAGCSHSSRAGIRANAPPIAPSSASGPAGVAYAAAAPEGADRPLAAAFSSTRDSVDVVTANGAVVVLDNGAVYAVGGHDRSAASSWSPGDQTVVSAGDDALTDLTTGVTVAVTPAGDAHLADPYSNTRAHRKDTNSHDGRIIVLSDGSIWVVSDPADRARASGWSDGSSIVAVDGAGPGRYELVNTGNPSVIHADYVGYE